MADYKTITYAVEGHFLADTEQIGIITLNRAGKLNAINDELVQDLINVFDEIAKDDNVRAVIIRSASDRAFSVGADLGMAAQLAGGDPKNSKEMLAAGQKLFRRIETFPKPVIAEIHGLTMGGGLEMCAACDIRMASKEAKFQAVEVRVGLIPGWGGTQRLTKIIGLGKAKEMILTGREVPADEALEIGLVSKVVPADELHAEALFIAQQIADNAPIAVRLAKEALNLSVEVPIEKGNEKELEGLIECFGTEDFGIGVSAVFSKSKPKFKGK